MSSGWSFSDYLNNQSDNMNRFSTNSKRPPPDHCDIETSKHRRDRQRNAEKGNSQAMFVSEDESDTQIEREVFGSNDAEEDLRPGLSSRDHPSPSTTQANAQRRKQASPSRRVNGPTTTNGHPSNHANDPSTSLSSSSARPGPAHSQPQTHCKSRAALIPAPLSYKSTSPPLPPSIRPQARATTIEIKDEPDTSTHTPTWLTTTSTDTDRIRIFIGRRNRIVAIHRNSLLKSPILSSYIIEDHVEGAYIMRPQLLKIDFNDFDAVLQFLHSGEYAPLLVEKERRTGSGDGEAGNLMELDGFVGDEAYSKELVRAGRIYVLAQMFQVQGLEELVYRKISEVDGRQYSLRSLVEVAGVVFSDKWAAAGPAEVSVGVGFGDYRKDKLEEWIVGRVAQNLQEITKIQHEEFWNIEKKTRKKMFLARVMEEFGDRYRATGGKLPSPVVELD